MADKPEIPKPRPYVEFTPERQELFFHFLMDGYNASSAARAVGVHPTTAFKFLYRHPELRELVEEAKEAGVDYMEDSMRQKAVDPKGFLPNIAWLKAHRPQKWGDRQGAVLAPIINITINAPSPQELRQIVDAEYKLLPEASEDGDYQYDHDAGDLT